MSTFFRLKEPLVNVFEAVITRQKTDLSRLDDCLAQYLIANGMLCVANQSAQAR